MANGFAGIVASLAATATSVEEIKHVASLGYEKFDEFEVIHVFRKSKFAV